MHAKSCYDTPNLREKRATTGAAIQYFKYMMHLQGLAGQQTFKEVAPSQNFVQIKLACIYVKIKGNTCRTRFVHREAPNPEKTTKNPQFVPMEELIAIKPARDN
jgi:hypothetical protein